MPLNPRDIREVEFAERLRGYNPDSVDEFLERVALRLEELEAEVERWHRRAEALDARLTEASADSEVLHRTLVMAQRTADQTLSEARANADQIVAEAEARATSIVSDAEFDARRRMAESTSEIRTEVSRLVSEREMLASHLVRLRERLGTERAEAISFYRQGIEWLALHIPAPDEPDEMADVIAAARNTAADLARLAEIDEAVGEPSARPAQTEQAEVSPASDSEAEVSSEAEAVPWQLPGQGSPDPDMTTVMPVIRADDDDAQPGVNEAAETTALRLDDLEQMDQRARESR